MKSLSSSIDEIKNWLETRYLDTNKFESILYDYGGSYGNLLDKLDELKEFEKED